MTRRKVQDLRLAKSTFFAMADENGVVIRNDQEQDRMAGKPLFPSFPGLADAKSRYTETTGSMPEASGVRAPRIDGQWVAGAPVKIDGVTKGLYVTGWSWSSYAYRLEFAIRGKIRSELVNKREENEPLVYVFVVVGNAAFRNPGFARSEPECRRGGGSARQDPRGRDVHRYDRKSRAEPTDWPFGESPRSDWGVAIAVLRSET